MLEDGNLCRIFGCSRKILNALTWGTGDMLNFLKIKILTLGDLKLTRSLSSVCKTTFQCNIYSSMLTSTKQTRQSVAVQREGGIPVGIKILHPYQGP